MTAAVFTSMTPSGGVDNGGETVTITGTGLTGSTGVLFGTEAATSVTVVSATTITCVTPAHVTGYVTITIQNPGGDGTGTNAFLYTNPPTGIDTVAAAVRARIAGSNAKSILGGVQQVLDRDEDPAILARNAALLPTICVFPLGAGKFTVNLQMTEDVLEDTQLVCVGYYRFSKDNKSPYADIDTMRLYAMRLVGLFRGWTGATPNFILSPGVFTKATVEVGPYQEMDYVINRWVVTFTVKLAEA